MCIYLIAPTAPSSLTIVNVTNATVTLSWTKPNPSNGIITQYQIQYRRNDNSINITSLNLTTNNTLTYTVTGLNSNTKYVFTVRASTIVGYGNASNAVIDYTSKLKYDHSMKI